MKIIFGIGNPGKQYKFTRHNIGFLVLDKLAEKQEIVFKPSKSDYYFARSTNIKTGRPFLLVKPTTYVNLSGNAVLELVNEFNINLSDLLIVTDDLNLPEGKIRVRTSGGDGGHNGIHNIIYQLQSDKFARIRFGIGKNFNQGEMKEFVLSEFTQEELSNLSESIKFSVSLIEEFIEGNTKKMLDFFSKNSQVLNKNTNATTNTQL